MKIYDRAYNCLACGQNLVTSVHGATCRYAEDNLMEGKTNER